MQFQSFPLWRHFDTLPYSPRIRFYLILKFIGNDISVSKHALFTWSVELVLPYCETAFLYLRNWNKLLIK